MKKRNSPILLITTLIVLICVAAGFQFMNGQNPLADRQAGQTSPPTDSKATGESRAPEKKEAVASSVKSALGAKKSKEDMADGGPSMMGHKPGDPLVKITKPQNMPVPKPKPNDSSISGQWYSDEANTKPGN